jgi:hypothetical protein
MPVTISGEFVSFDDGDICGNGTIERLIAFLKSHIPPPPPPDDGDPIMHGVKLSEEVHGELLELSRSLIETTERFEHVLKQGVREAEGATR